LRWGNP